MTREEQIAELKENIRQGEEFQRQGYDCEMMMSITRVLLAKLEGDNK